LLQPALLAVHKGRLPPIVGVQHACPEAPQLPQLPLLHMPPTLGHVVPAAVHTSRMQQPPLPQLLPGQQGCPGPPQLAHRSLLHAWPLPHWPPGQQASPAAPQETQLPLAHAAPGLHVPSAQHFPPELPQLKKALLAVQPPTSDEAKTTQAMNSERITHLQAKSN
jgi:hypothetical protein